MDLRRVTLAFTVRGHGLDRGGVERAVDPAVAKDCSVLSTVGHAATIVHATDVVEETAAA